MNNQDIVEELQRARKLVVRLAKEIDVKNEKLLEMEIKLDEISEALSKMKTEQTRLHQEYIEEQRKRKLASQYSEKLHQKLESLMNELEMTVKRLDKLEAEHDLERKNLLLENEKLKAQNSLPTDHALIVQLDDLKKELDEKVDELECMDNLNQTLILKEHMSNLELQHARKELINGLRDCWDSHTKIGIKRMGEVDPAPFKDACLKKFPGDWELKSTESCSLWQNLVNNPEWYPFKMELTDGKSREIISCDDIMLKELRSEWGDEVYKAVSNALLELNEYNGSGRYIVMELWNFKEGRKASLKEAVECIIQELKTQKSHKRRR
ncbi:hypothetical protein REPUB_Repub03eG0213500 [Reevesia pubescens]